ncbi:hypothetical protein EBU24_03390 [bacterium]|jgi:hypothetical protein|nr:hypothetical protein [bacterium]
MAKKKKKDPIAASINKAMKKAISSITKPIMQIIKYFKCGINKIINLPKCIIFYIFDIIIGTFFLFWSLIASLIPGLKDLGKIIWKSLKMLDKYIYKFTGIHILRYSRSILKRCYLC